MYKSYKRKEKEANLQKLPSMSIAKYALWRAYHLKDTFRP